MEDDDFGGGQTDAGVASNSSFRRLTTSGLLTDELLRRVTIHDQSQGAEAADLGLLQPLFFVDESHEAMARGASQGEASGSPGSNNRWRQKERSKTTSVALVVCLNIGVDPPDVIKISPCARMECWVDPQSLPQQKALEAIGKNLQAQYERWQPRAKYKVSLDPTVDDVKKLCISCRRNAKNERVLFHYNGHGVPRPTVNGEVWVFNKSYTQYIPLSIYDLQTWVGTPAIHVYDCSGAEIVVNAYRAFMEQRFREEAAASSALYGGTGGPTAAPGGISAHEAMRGSLLLAACGANETLPQNPDLPADLFTACLTTPIKVALRWFSSRSLLHRGSITSDHIDRVPGKQTDRKTPLGELNWIFTAITDTIAWNVLPRPLFQRLFRQDLLVASLFRNYLLAERVMAASGCTPVTYPRLPPTHQHPMWQAWDMAAEMCLTQLPTLLANPEGAEFQPSPFFAEQLTAFEMWLQHGSSSKQPPEQLPIVLQVLLSQSHRLRALVLLGRFLDLGPWAVELSLSVGIFPYVLKLLQTTALDLRQVLVFIWTKVMALDRSCQVDLVKDSGHLYFIKYLDSADPATPLDTRAMSAFILATVCDGHAKGQLVCASANLLGVCLGHLSSLLQQQGPELLIRWLCLCAGKLWEDMVDVADLAFRERAHLLLAPLLSAALPELRACATFALGSLISLGETDSGLPVGAGSGGTITDSERAQLERHVTSIILGVAGDASPLVRAEAAVALARFACAQGAAIKELSAPLMQGRTSGSSTPPLQSQGSSGSMDGRVRGGQAAALFPAATPTAPVPLGSPSGLGSSSLPSPPPQGEGLAIPLTELCSAALEALLALATDPHPMVCKAGAQALRVAGLEVETAGEGDGDRLVNYQTGGSESVPTSRKSSRWGLLGSSSGKSPSPHGDMSSSLGGRMSTGAPAFVLRSVSALPRASGAAIALESARGALGSGSARPSQDGSGMGGVGPRDSLDSNDSRRSGAPSTGGLPGGLPGSSGNLEAAPPTVNTSHAVARRRGLPLSLVFRTESERFSRPLLDPTGRFASVILAPSELASAAIPNGPRQQERAAEMDAAIARCREQCRGARLREQVLHIDVAQAPVTCALFAPLSPYLVTGTARGTLQVSNYRGQQTLNTFHMSGSESCAPSAGPAPGAVVASHLSVVNELQDPLLLAGFSDGSVRVWRRFYERGSQSMLTAWRAVPWTRPGSSSSSSAAASGSRGIQYEYLAQAGSLAAVGGGAPSLLRIWDLAREVCTQQITVRPLGLDASTEAFAVHRLRSIPDLNLLCAGGGDGSLQLFDLRDTRQPALELRPLRSAMIGLVSSPGVSTRLTVGSKEGLVTLMDLRVAAAAAAARGSVPGLECSVVRTFEAHTKAPMTCMAVHPHCPLMATGTSSRMMKVWTTEGDLLGSIKPTGVSSLLSGGGAAINGLRFSPHKLHLCSWGMDNGATVYSLANM